MEERTHEPNLVPRYIVRDWRHMWKGAKQCGLIAHTSSGCAVGHCVFTHKHKHTHENCRTRGESVCCEQEDASSRTQQHRLRLCEDIYISPNLFNNVEPFTMDMGFDIEWMHSIRLSSCCASLYPTSWHGIGRKAVQVSGNERRREKQENRLMIAMILSDLRQWEKYFNVWSAEEILIFLTS